MDNPNDAATGPVAAGNSAEVAANSATASKSKAGKMPGTTLIIGIVVIVVIAIGAAVYLSSSKGGANYPASTVAGTNTQQSSYSSTIGSAQGVTKKSYYDNVTCTTTSSVFNCTPDRMAIDHFGNATEIDLHVGQNTGTDWDHVNVSFVPAGTSYVNGIPQVNFSSPSQSIDMIFLWSKSKGDMVIGLPVSPKHDGIFTGQLWARYYFNGNSTPNYAHIGNITVNTAGS